MVFFGCALGVFALGLLASSVSERRNEATASRVQFMTNIGDFESDNSKWGVNFPREFDSWEATKNIEEETKYGGSKTKDYLAERPLTVVMFAGFGFAKDYNSPRGHYWALTDVTGTKRRSSKTPATCYSCKSPDVPRLMAQDGVAGFYGKKFDDYTKEVTNPIGCADCHSNKTMALQISRPALAEAFDRQGKDITKSTHQEMRSLACAQCHVSYYFKDKKSNELVFPWDNGLAAEDFEKYYDKVGFSDWTHSISGAKMVKLRHPDYEIYSTGIHAFRGVSCADCHMPYKSEGGIKFTDHQVRSPLLTMSNSCQVCHRWSEKDIKARVYSIQDKTRDLLDRAMGAIASLHLEIADAIELGATDVELDASRKLVSKAQIYWDYVASSNGMGIHAPQECARVLAKSIDIAMQGRLLVSLVRSGHGAKAAIELPDLATKDKAQAFIKPFVDAQAAAMPK